MLDPVYQTAHEPKFIDESCISDIWLDNGESCKAVIEFKYQVVDHFANVIVTKIHEDFTACGGQPTDLRHDVLQSIKKYIDRKVNEISWT